MNTLYCLLSLSALKPTCKRMGLGGEEDPPLLCSQVFQYLTACVTHSFPNHGLEVFKELLSWTREVADVSFFGLV